MAGCSFFVPLREPVIAAVAPVADLLTLALPTGWVIYPLHGRPMNPSALAWLTMLPAACLIALAIQEGRASLPKLPLRDLALLAYAAEPPESCLEAEIEEFQRRLEHPAPVPAAAAEVAQAVRAPNARPAQDLPLPSGIDPGRFDLAGAGTGRIDRS